MNRPAVVFVFLQYIIFCNYVNAFRGEPIEKVPEDDESYSYVVSLGPWNHPRHHFCSGVLISNKHVLTTKRCMDGGRVSELRVTVSHDNHRVRGTKYHILAVKNYAQWAKEVKLPGMIYGYHDIAIWTLNGTTPKHLVKFPKLTTKSKDYFYDKTVESVGWGRTNKDTLTTTLHKVKLHVISADHCMENIKRFFDKTYYVEDGQFCSNAINEFPILISEGDTGGPVLYDGELIGINEGTYPREDENNPIGHQKNLHLSIVYYRTFIDSFINPPPQVSEKPQVSEHHPQKKPCLIK